MLNGNLELCDFGTFGLSDDNQMIIYIKDFALQASLDNMQEQLNQFREYVIFWQEEIGLRVEALHFNPEQHSDEEEHTRQTNKTLIQRAI